MLLFDHFKPQNYIEHNTGIDNVRLNKLLTDPKKRPYAEELNNIAKLMGIKSSQLFEYFYGDGERPVIGLLPKPAEGKES
ncbi:helix-turn-helix domain-containing protein [Sphingobacterium anhuiense]|uniref:helix-turn-helix domain-containing protein n=1 Tax=Sphingobacterium anhuiense TaxID=493780 RepID=UPI003C30DAB5